MAQYDTIADAYTRAKSYNPVDNFCFYPRFYEAVGDVRGKSALDLACGVGKIGYAILARGAAGVLGVDESAEMIALAKTHPLPGCYMEFLQVRVGAMGQIGQFDIVTAGWLLHYARTEDELKRMCKDIAVNLKPDGIFVALNGNPNHPLGGCEKYGYAITAKHKAPQNGDVITVRCFGNGGDATFETRYWTILTYINAMREAGLDLELIIPDPTLKGIEEMGSEWWDELKKQPTTAIFKCRHVDAK